MLQSVNLRDYMLTNPVKVRGEDNVLDAMQVIIDNKISGVCVVDKSASCPNWIVCGQCLALSTITVASVW